MAKGDPAVQIHVQQCFINAHADLAILRKFTVKKKKNVDADTLYDLQVLVRGMEAELNLIDANLIQMIRVRTQDQPTSKAGGRRKKSGQ